MAGTTTPAERASQAAAATKQARRHLDQHDAHREAHEMVALAGGAFLGGEQAGRHPLAQRVMDQHGHRIPLTPKETAAVESLIGDHGQAGLTRRDPGNTGPVVASFLDAVYEIDGDTVTKVEG